MTEGLGDGAAAAATPAPAAAAATPATSGGFWSGAGAAVGGTLGVAAALAPALASAKPTTGKTVVKKGKTIFQKAPPTPKSSSVLPWVAGGVGALLVIGVGAWLLLRKKG